MMKVLRRRAVLKAGGAAAAASALGACRPHGSQPAAVTSAPLVTDPQQVLDLPPGFHYRILQHRGDAMSDGYRVPGRPDAMGCFAGKDGRVVLMRNHEMTEALTDALANPYNPGQAPPPEAYDPDGNGGVTRLVLNPDTLAIEHSNLVLCGTYWNCAGGLSPWGWLSCEETVVSERHGYVFLCATDSNHVLPPHRITGYGRMRHEAASVDPATHIAYLTEDRPDGCFYRFVPSDRDKPFEGKLQALRVRDHAAFNTAQMPARARVAIDWVDVDHPDAPDDSLRLQAQAKGAAVVCRGEGLWLAPGEAFFCATAGGRLARGQVFRLRHGDKPSLEVVAEATDLDTLDMPDNLCVSPHGQLYVAEDGLGGNFIRRITLDGRVLPFARNAASLNEFAGPCFSPDGRTLFVNIQGDGLTFAIRGPFERPLPGETTTRASAAHHGPDVARGARGVGSGLAVLALAAFVRSRRARQAR
jgi:secreted PhoX family phosphatase